MKKVILLFSLLGLFNSSRAQDFEAGFQGGLITSQISGDASGGYYRFGATGGLFVKCHFRGPYSGEFAITLAPKGSKRFVRDSKGRIIREEYRLRLAYIEIPILFQYTLDTLSITLEIGPSIGILLGQEEEEAIIVSYGDFNKTETGIMVGATKRFSDKFSFSIRGSHSVLTVRKHPSGGIWKLNRGQYNTALMAFFKFHFN